MSEGTGRHKAEKGGHKETTSRGGPGRAAGGSNFPMELSLSFSLSHTSITTTTGLQL